jgi:hypothetical protein
MHSTFLGKRISRPSCFVYARCVCHPNSLANGSRKKPNPDGTNTGRIIRSSHPREVLSVRPVTIHSPRIESLFPPHVQRRLRRTSVIHRAGNRDPPMRHHIELQGSDRAFAATAVFRVRVASAFRCSYRDHHLHRAVRPPCGDQCLHEREAVHVTDVSSWRLLKQSALFSGRGRVPSNRTVPRYVTPSNRSSFGKTEEFQLW